MMPVGVLTDCSCVLIGGLLGTVLGSRFTLALREKLTMVLGFASMAIGINSIVKANQMTPVVIAVIFGTLLGELLHLEEHITHVFGAVTRKLPHDEANFDMERYITVVVLFCASGFGIYGVLVGPEWGHPPAASRPLQPPPLSSQMQASSGASGSLPLYSRALRAEPLMIGVSSPGKPYSLRVSRISISTSSRSSGSSTWSTLFMKTMI